MEKWISFDKINIRIKLIDSITIRTCGEGCSINLMDNDKRKYVLTFDSIDDLRYAIENAFISRVSKVSREILESNSIFVVEESEYLKNFKYGVDGTIPIEDMKHFLIFDSIDTGIEILTNREPVLERRREEKDH